MKKRQPPFYRKLSFLLPICTVRSYIFFGAFHSVAVLTRYPPADHYPVAVRDLPPNKVASVRALVPSKAVSVRVLAPSRVVSVRVLAPSKAVLVRVPSKAVLVRVPAPSKAASVRAAVSSQEVLVRAGPNREVPMWSTCHSVPLFLTPHFPNPQALAASALLSQSFHRSPSAIRPLWFLLHESLRKWNHKPDESADDRGIHRTLGCLYNPGDHMRKRRIPADVSYVPGTFPVNIPDPLQ